MITIKEIRQKYPDYNDISDKQLVDSLHKKHYSDMPIEDFYSKIGFNQKSSSSLTRAADYVSQDVPAFGKNLLTGYLKMGRGLANTPHKLGALVGLGDIFGELAPENFDYSKSIGLPIEQENKAVQAVPEIAASFALPGSTIPRMIAAQSAFGATQNKNPLLGALEGGVGALAGVGFGKLLEKGINALKPSKLLRGALSPEKLVKNLKNTKGTETSLGNVIESPSLQRLSENILPHVIGSGAEKSAQRTANKVTEKGESLLHDLRGGVEVNENYGEKIKTALKESAQAAEREKTSKFRKVNEIAEEHGVNTDRSNLRKEAKSILSQIKSDPDLAQFTNTADIKLLEDIAETKKPKIKYSKIIDVHGASLETTVVPKTYSLKNTDILRGKIGENAHEANVKGEKPKAAIYARLKKALEQDVEQAIEKSPHQELKNAHTEAMDYYKNEYALFKDKDIQKFVKQGGDPDLILSHFLKMGSNDRVQLLRKLSQLKGIEKGLIGNAYLSPAYENGRLNPLKLSTLYHKLGKRQKVELFGEGDSQKLNNYTDLVRKNKEGFNLMFNPKTGARLGHIGTIAGLAGSAGSHIPAAIGMGALGNIANRLLTSESFREKLIKAMFADKKIKLPVSMSNLSKAGAIAAKQQE